MTKARNTFIDFIKGILIILVILGHFIPGTIEGNRCIYMIYTVHMPLFFGISGFLLNPYKLKELSLKDFLKKYGKKLFLPWASAVMIYYFIECYKNHATLTLISSLKLLILRFISPYYHLWFLQSLMVFIFITWLLLRFLKKKIALFFMGFLAILGFLLCCYFWNKTGYSGWLKYLRMAIVHFQFDNYFYFLFGMLLFAKIETLEKHKAIGISSLAIGSTALVFRFFMYQSALPLSEVHSIYYALVDLPLLTTIIYFSRSKKSEAFCFLPLTFLGQHTLPIYLWHILLKEFFLLIYGA